ncbi:class I SAM-dependent methyltransferase [Humidesulfovibrio sp.]
MSAPRLLNLGCGCRFHPDWLNVDLVSRHPEVMECDLSCGLPFAEASMDAVYASHMLEHLERHEASSLLSECRRVLRPGGVLRLAVPDFEAMARLYVQILDGCLAGDEEARRRYEWITLELFDQLVRTRPGGDVVRYWAKDPMPAEAFVFERVGEEARRAIDALRAKGGALPPEPQGAEAQARFRKSGELHRWMYDRWSLACLLTQAGFAQPQACGADASAIPGFAAYGLETDEQGRVRKPDSLFMEALRP